MNENFIPLTTIHKTCCGYCKHFVVRIKKATSTLLHSSYCGLVEGTRISLPILDSKKPCVQYGCNQFKASGKPFNPKTITSRINEIIPNEEFIETVPIDEFYKKTGIEFLYDPDYPTQFEKI